MCGRFTIIDIEDIRERFNTEPISLKPSYNVAPTQDVPVIINDGSNHLDMFRWGLIPFWAKDSSIGNKLINARAETLDEKPSFKHCLQRKRCLVVADGFYEWKKEGSGKRPHRITLKNKELFGFAGLWDTWKQPTGDIINSCSIITTTPNDLMAPIHHRMPVILPREVEHVWLDQGVTDSSFLKSLLIPYPSDLMMAYEVSKLVNSPKNNGTECLASVESRLF
ncbi:Gifsy-2 prophage protein [Desulfosporosinus sp. I2]|uniref:SOS response-associated peptidase n=1 Tax=Desulfosporosinus sp. I2 TaxID=1617025 RepID=UPI0005EEB658|nr:SOS response-associated peptidase [Desulfosporosinus sp. I2]KJR48057.1 Gifsy-2 prophage protein [Desulfosporosinus sp. I2]